MIAETQQTNKEAEAALKEVLPEGTGVNIVPPKGSVEAAADTIVKMTEAAATSDDPVANEKLQQQLASLNTVEDLNKYVEDNQPKVEETTMDNTGKMTLNFNQKLKVLSDEEIAQAMNTVSATPKDSTPVRSTDGANRRRML